MDKQWEEIVISNINQIHVLVSYVFVGTTSMYLLNLLIVFINNVFKPEFDDKEIWNQSFYFIQHLSFFTIYYLMIIGYQKVVKKYPFVSSYYGEGLVTLELCICVFSLKIDNTLNGFNSFPFLFSANVLNIILFSKEWKWPIIAAVLCIALFVVSCSNIDPNYLKYQTLLINDSIVILISLVIISYLTFKHKDNDFLNTQSY